MEVQIGKEAPGFITAAYHQGSNIEVRLREYRGRWVVLVFYLRDFTPV